MSYTVTRHSFKLSWALALGLTASTLLQGTAAAEPATTTNPATTTDVASPAVDESALRDRWYLDPAPPPIAPAISAQMRDQWYLYDSAPPSMLARSHRSQEAEVRSY